MYSRPFSSERRIHESLFAWIVGLIDEISTKRIHIEEKKKFYLFAYGVNDLSHLAFLITFETINVITTVDASCVPFWFLVRKYALENSLIVCRVPLQGRIQDFF